MSRGDPTMETAVWTALRKHGPCDRNTLCELTGYTPDQVTHVCQRLRRAGRLSCERKPYRPAKLTAIGKGAPRDKRGALKGKHRGPPYAIAYRNWFLMMRKRHGPEWKPPVRTWASDLVRLAA